MQPPYVQQPGKDYILIPLWTADPPFPQEPKSSQDAGFKLSNDVKKKVNEVPRQEIECKDQEEKDNVNNTNRVNVVSSTVNAASNKVNVVGRKSSIKLLDDLNMPDLEDISIFEESNEDVFGAEADLNNLESTFQVFKNKLDERGIMIRNKARLVAQGHTQEEGIDYDKFFAPVARIEVTRLFLAYDSFNDFMVYQMDVKSAFLYGKIKEEVYVCQPPGFEDPDFPDKVYKVEKALYGLHQASRAWYETLSTYLLDNGFQRGKIDMTLFIQKHKASTPMKTQKPLLKDEEVDVYIYRSMIGSLTYLISLRPDIMFACKKQNVVANSKTKADYYYWVEVSAASLVRDTTTASSLEAEQDSGNIDKTQTKATSDEPSSQGTSLGNGPKHQDTMGNTSAYTRVISSSDDEALDKEDISKQRRIDEIDADEDTALVITHNDVSIQDNIVQDKGLEDVGEEEVVEIVTTPKMIIDTNVEVTQAPKRKGVRIQEPEEKTITKTASSQQPKVQNKGKGKAKQIEEPKMPKKRKHQIRADKELAKKLQAKMQAKINEEARLARERAQKEQEANDALVNTWDDIQAKIDLDAQLAQRLHEEEQQQFTNAEKAKLFMEFIKKIRKFFARKRNEEKRNKPPTKAQQRSIMSTYLKNIDG
nr:copia protein [Tanacetum cinerariifolium]